MADTSTFSNNHIDNEQLPSLTELEFQPLAANYAQINRYINLGGTAILMLIGLIICFQPFFELSLNVQNIIIYVIWAIAAIGLLTTVYSAKADVLMFYSLRDLDVSFTSGLIFRKTVSQPILRIQHVELKRGPIDRKVGFAKLQVFSAGGAMHTFEIPGLPLATAESIRQFILSHKDASQHG